MLIPVIRNRYFLLGIFMASIVIILSGCQSSIQEKESRTPEKDAKTSSEMETFQPNVDSITQDFTTFWNYWNAHTKLSFDYLALNELGEKVDHGSFLKSLKGGRYLPVLVKKDGSKSYYKLVKIPKKSDLNISETISYAASRYYKYSQLEGKPLPEFHFKDLDGHVYNLENCQGKVLVLNTWFVKCAACKEEMPDLNRLVAAYKNRKDMVFLGLCLDDADQIHSFLDQVYFTYQIIPDASVYIEEQLHTGVFPTSIIVDKAGKVVKVMEGDAPSLKLKLAKVASQH